MTPIGINGIETNLTPELAQKLAGGLTQQEKIEMIKACQASLEENLKTPIKKAEESIQTDTDQVKNNIEQITEDDIKITIFGNAYGWIQAGEE